MIENNFWDQELGGQLGTLTLRNQTHLFRIAFAIQSLKTELIIGPNYQNIDLVYKEPYGAMKKIMKRYTKDAESPIYEMKLNIIEYLLTMIEGGLTNVVNEHLSNVSPNSLEILYCNCLKQAYFSIVKKAELDRAEHINDIRLSDSDM